MILLPKCYQTVFLYLTFLCSLSDLCMWSSIRFNSLQVLTAPVVWFVISVNRYLIYNSCAFVILPAQKAFHSYCHKQYVWFSSLSQWDLTRVIDAILSVICTLQLIEMGETVKSPSSILPKLYTSLCNVCVCVCVCVYACVGVRVQPFFSETWGAYVSCRMLRAQSMLIETCMTGCYLNICILTNFMKSVKHSVC